MTVKKEYSIGDTVWVYGITGPSNKITKGSVVHKLEIPGYSEIHYVIAIPTEIEDLLELRTWQNISQDSHGPIGAFRTVREHFAATKKFINKTGFMSVMEDSEELDEPTAEEIHAAIEKAQQATTHQPLHIKENKPRKRTFRKKKI